MRKEILRMDQVTYEYQGVTQLDDFSLSVWEGEILGLVPVNNWGVVPADPEPAPAVRLCLLPREAGE